MEGIKRWFIAVSRETQSSSSFVCRYFTGVNNFSFKKERKNVRWSYDDEGKKEEQKN